MVFRYASLGIFTTIEEGWFREMIGSGVFWEWNDLETKNRGMKILTDMFLWLIDIILII